MALHGSIGQFDRDSDDWDSYCERFEQYATANEIVDPGKRRAVFLSVCGAPTYELIHSLVALGKPNDKTLQELAKLVKEHLSPILSSTVQGFHFNARVQSKNESVAQYVTELRRLVESCEFGASLENMLRDRLVCGLGDPRTQRRLLAELQLTFSKALEIAQAAELAEKSVKDLPSQAHTDSTTLMWSRDNKEEAPSHARAAVEDTSTCRHRTAECYACGKQGHLAKECRSSKMVPRERPRSPTQSQRQDWAF